VATSTISITPVGDTPVAPGIVTLEDTQSGAIVLDRNASDGVEVSHFRISNISGGTLYHNDGATVINDGDYITYAEGNAGLKFTPSTNATAPGTFDVESSEDGSTVATQSSVATSTITVTPIGDTPIAPSVGTVEDTQSGAIVLERHANDGPEVTHFRISNISGGALYHSDGATVINDGDYITYVEGNAGLKFTPSTNATAPGSFDVESSQDGSTVAAQSGVSTSTITVTPVGDTPVAPSVGTVEDTQSGAIVLERHANDGTEVTHFRISNISGGTLYHSDGATVINDGDYITYVEGNAGLKFTPSTNATAPGTFDVESSQDGTTVAAQSGVATSTITVTSVGDTPVAPSIVTLEDTQSGAIVLERHANDGAEVSHFRISNISGGTLYHSDGATVINDGDYITYAEGNAGLKFTPSANATAAGSFDVESSQDGAAVAAQSGVATSTITITPVGDTPVAPSLVTPEDIQSGAIVLDRHATDGPEVTHFRISNISGGTLYQNDGTTVINNGDYITYAEGNAGLKFTPSTNAIAAGSFDVESSEDGSTVAAQSGVTTSTITVNAVNDAPVNSVPGVQTNIEDTPIEFSDAGGNAISISDVDAGSNDVQVTLTATGGAVTITDMVGEEFQVNMTTTDDQKEPQVAADANGNYVVVWESGGFGAKDVYARQFYADGTPVDDEFLVNTITTANDQKKATVAVSASGDFVVVWESGGPGAKDVYARQFNADGTAVDDEFLVNTITTANDQKEPGVGIDDAGNFVIVWESGEPGAKDVYARQFNADGTAVDDEFLVNTITTANDQKKAAVAVSASGDFVVVWESGGPGDKDVYARQFNADGTAVDDEFLVNTTTSNEQKEPDVAIDDAGKFVVVWEGRDADMKGVFFQRFDSDGSKLGIETGVNTTTSGDQKRPVVTMDTERDFVIAWEGNGALDDSGVHAQRYDSAGNAVGGEFLVNTETADKQERVSVTTDSDGDLVVVWDSMGQDGDKDGVYAQQYLRPEAFNFSVGDGEADTTMTFTGSIDDINQALDGLVFDPDPNHTGATSLRIFTDDLGNTGSGVNLTDDDTVAISITPVGDTPQAPDIITFEDTQSGAIVLERHASDGPEVTHFRISNISGGTLYQADGVTVINAGDYITYAEGNAGLKFTPAANATAAASFDVQSSEDGTTVAAQSGVATSTITVTPVGDTPVAPSVATVEDTQSGAIVLERNVNDGPEVTHFRISGISNGNLYHNDGVTLINDGDYITVAEGNVGLKFTPSANSTAAGSFDVESSEDGLSVAAQSAKANSTITVTPVGDTPVAPGVVILEDTQSGAIVLERHANDGAEVTHFRISNISGGTLYQNDGTTVINAGDYITYAEGNAGLKFTPAANATAAASFDVQSSQDGTTVAAQSGVATSTIDHHRHAGRRHAGRAECRDGGGHPVGCHRARASRHRRRRGHPLPDLQHQRRHALSERRHHCHQCG